MDDMWVCPACHSINVRGARRCYSCKAKKPSAQAIALALDPSREAPPASPAVEQEAASGASMNAGAAGQSSTGTEDGPARSGGIDGPSHPGFSGLGASLLTSGGIRRASDVAAGRPAEASCRRSCAPGRSVRRCRLARRSCGPRRRHCRSRPRRRYPGPGSAAGSGRAGPASRTGPGSRPRAGGRTAEVPARPSSLVGIGQGIWADSSHGRVAVASSKPASEGTQEGASPQRPRKPSRSPSTRRRARGPVPGRLPGPFPWRRRPRRPRR